LKPYHSVQWLENRGNLRFVHHEITPMYGVHRAVAADITGKGRLDIVAVSFLPSEGFPRRQEQKLDSVILLEQVPAGPRRDEKAPPIRFVRHRLETGTCDHVTCAVGDVTGRGRQDLVIGAYGSPRGSSPVTIWKNLPR
jgi:hypothetical protein